MPTLILSNRYTEDSQRLWRAAGEMGWDVERLVNWRLPKKPLYDPVIYVESLFAPMVADGLGITLSEPPEAWMDELPIRYKQRLVALTNAGKARELLKEQKDRFANGACTIRDGKVVPYEGRNYFIKPPNDKSFPAKEYKELPDYIPDSTSILLQSVVEWEKEFRCFCLDSKVLTLSVYSRHGMLQKHEDWYATPEELQQAKDFAEEVMKNIKTPKAIVMDVGVIKDDDRGWAVVELNAAWGSGIYGCNPKKVLEVIKECGNNV